MLSRSLTCIGAVFLTFTTLQSFLFSFFCPHQDPTVAAEVDLKRRMVPEKPPAPNASAASSAVVIADSTNAAGTTLDNNNIKSKPNGTIESYMIGFWPQAHEEFEVRNQQAQFNSLWWPATDGFQQKTLEIWASMNQHINDPVIDLAKFTGAKRKDPAGPHAVGCFLSHWHLFRTLHHRPEPLRPSAYLIFEDDAACAPTTKDKVLEVVEQLPEDWDFLYLGGNPHVWFKGNKDYKGTMKDAPKDVCKGEFGKGDSPLAPDGTRDLSYDQPYWKTNYILNTHAYAINPKRMDTIYNVLNPNKRKRGGRESWIAIDLRLTTAFETGALNAYMTTQMYCDMPRDGTYRRPGRVLKPSLHFGRGTLDLEDKTPFGLYGWQVELFWERSAREITKYSKGTRANMSHFA